MSPFHVSHVPSSAEAVREAHRWHEEWNTGLAPRRRRAIESARSVSTGAHRFRHFNEQATRHGRLSHSPLWRGGLLLDNSPPIAAVPWGLGFARQFWMSPALSAIRNLFARFKVATGTGVIPIWQDGHLAIWHSGCSRATHSRAGRKCPVALGSFVIHRGDVATKRSVRQARRRDGQNACMGTNFFTSGGAWSTPNEHE
jgi:hypothetical protein